MEKDTAAADLAFLRTLVQAGDDGERQFGEAYFWSGLCYGVQMLLHGAQLLGWIGQGFIGLVIGIGPTIAFAIVMTWLSIKNRRPRPPSVAARTVGAVFAAAGTANLALIVIIGLFAWRKQSLEVWLIYPCAVMAMQGAAWMVAWQVRRQALAAVVSAGWFATAIGMGISIGHPAAFVIVTGIGMWAFMVAPGAIMMRRARKAA